jgi:hypothetical protein
LKERLYVAAQYFFADGASGGKNILPLRGGDFKALKKAKHLTTIVL